MFEALEDIWTKVRNFNDYTRALVTLTTTIGAVFVIYIALKLSLKLFRAFKLYFLSQYNCLCSPDFKTKYGRWAVISGATDGIGQAMARELARRGMSIVIIGRNEEKLANTKALLEQEPNAGEVVTVKIDLSDSSLENFDKIRSQIDPDNREIGMLINNAGGFISKFRRYNRHDMASVKTLVDLNILATLHLTRMIMPGIIERGRGIVINVSSQIGSFPAPYMGVYGPTKTFIDAFSKQLQAEYASHPIKIINLTPGAVHTNLFKANAKMSEPSMVNPSPEDFARTALNALSSGVSEYSGTAFHGFSKEIMAIFDWFGLIPFALRLNMKYNSKDYETSPVPKRKRFVEGAGFSSRGDETHVNLSRIHS